MKVKPERISAMDWEALMPAIPEEYVKKCTFLRPLSYHRGFLKSVLAKLENARFVENAPDAVVNKEKKKRDDVEKKIQALEERITDLRG